MARQKKNVNPVKPIYRCSLHIIIHPTLKLTIGTRKSVEFTIARTVAVK